MSFPKDVFQAYDIRGKSELITEELAEAVGRAVVQKTGAKRVAVGRDMRKTSPTLARALIRGVTSVGADVLDVGLTTTPLFYFAVTSHEDVGAGVMVTASHNPAAYNGMKLFDGSCLPISPSDIYDELEPLMPNAERPGLVQEEKLLESYLDRCFSFVDVPDVSRMKIVVDYGNGMGALTFQPLFHRLGLSPVELYPEPDARFPHHEANPAKEETLQDLKAAVVREGADFGIALDGDADRIGFVDNEGGSLRGDLSFAIFAKEVLQRKPGSTIVITPNQSWAVMHTIEQNGGTFLEEKVGPTFIVPTMREHHAALSGEVSSHYYFEEFQSLESPEYAFLRMLSILVSSGTKLADLARDLRTYANSGEVNLELRDKAAALAALKESYASVASRVSELDGLRCEFNRDWWFLARPSNTEPVLRVTVEARDENLMQEKRDELVDFLKNL